MCKLSFLNQQKCRTFPVTNVTLTDLTQPQGTSLSFQGKTPRQLKFKNQYGVISVSVQEWCPNVLPFYHSLNYQTRCDWCVKRVNFRFLKFGHVSKRANILLTMNGRTRNLARGLHNGLTQRPLEHELRLLESSEPIPPRKQQNQGSKYTWSNHKDHPMWQQLKFNLEPRISSRGSNLDFPLLFRKKRPVASTVYNVCLLPKSNQT